MQFYIYTCFLLACRVRFGLPFCFVFIHSYTSDKGCRSKGGRTHTHTHTHIRTTYSKHTGGLKVEEFAPFLVPNRSRFEVVFVFSISNTVRRFICNEQRRQRCQRWCTGVRDEGLEAENVKHTRKRFRFRFCVFFVRPAFDSSAGGCAW